MTRSAVLEVMREDYIHTAWAKGLHERIVVSKHTLKNAMLPVITIIGAELAFLLGGLMVTETVFTLNGLGRFMVDAILHRDIPLLTCKEAVRRHTSASRPGRIWHRSACHRLRRSVGSARGCSALSCATW
jgi:hypothetical protein